jgi:uncharacterized damage-inducible protein DinB
MIPEQVQTLSFYNRTMNDKVFAAAANLTDEERKRDAGAFFRSVHGTLNHILWADGVWLSRFQGAEFPGGDYAHELSENFKELQQLRLEMDLRIADWAAGLSTDWLNGAFDWTATSGAKKQAPTWLLVTHLFNHATHHRGQITTLLSQQGVDVGVTDLPPLIR